MTLITIIRGGGLMPSIYVRIRMNILYIIVNLLYSELKILKFLQKLEAI